MNSRHILTAALSAMAVLLGLASCSKEQAAPAATGASVTLEPQRLSRIREVDPLLVSYNIEMTEVTGGTFWKGYTPQQVAGTEPVDMSTPDFSDAESVDTMMQQFPPIDLSHPRIRKLAAELGPAWIRVSGTWATKTYYDFDGHTGGVVPQGFDSILTEEQWRGVLDFVRAVDGKLLISLANNDGIHAAHEPWTPEQAKIIFDYSRDYGVPISAVEFVNEPNLFQFSGLPAGYTAADYARDQDIFCRFVRENYPETLLVGPCMMMDALLEISGDEMKSLAMASGLAVVGTQQMMELFTERLDVFSYHCYTGISERGLPLPGDWTNAVPLSEEYLAIPGLVAEYYLPFRDKFIPGGQMWVTESADSAAGGATWASTYLDVPRTLNELGVFPTITDGVIFHNTLASSDYGWLTHSSFEPRPNYFAALLWNRLMGTTVYDAGVAAEGAHVFAHSRKDGREGVAYLVINNSPDTATEVALPAPADIYLLEAESLRATTMTLNGQPLELGPDDQLPAMEPVRHEAGTITIPPAGCAFILL